MATRAIVTSHPVVACDVCGRSLLRGETPDVFLAGGQRRTVCELCVPRAAAEGWLREADNHASSVRPTRARRAGSLLGRLRQLREPGQGPLRRERHAAADFEGTDTDAELHEEDLYDFLDGEAERRRSSRARDLHRLCASIGVERGRVERRGRFSAARRRPGGSERPRELVRPVRASLANRHPRPPDLSSGASPRRAEGRTGARGLQRR